LDKGKQDVMAIMAMVVEKAMAVAAEAGMAAMYTKIMV
jgi:hypothetical protein